jgi:hypothetical protein
VTGSERELYGERIEKAAPSPPSRSCAAWPPPSNADVHLTGGHDLGSVWFGEVAPRFTGLRAISSSAGPRRAPSRRPRHWAGKPVTDG